jgi:pre-rRNA-processing protein IPI1
VLVQTRHPNAHVRRESIGHVRDVLAAGVALGMPLGSRHGEVAKVVRAIGALVSDEEQSVRRALHDFVGWYLARLPPLALSAYLPTLTLQISSGLSHIFPAIRLDTCRLVLLLLESGADIVGAWPNKAPSASSLVGSAGIFDGLRLAAGLGEEKASAGYRLDGKGKLVILRTIRGFVQRALHPDAAEGEGAALGSWSLADLVADDWSLGDYSWALEWTQPAAAEGGDGASAELESTYAALHSLLLSTFMEAAPAAFASSPDDTALALCAESAALVRLFAAALLGAYAPPDAAPTRTRVAEFLKRMAGYFPFAGSETHFALSLDYARLAALLAPRAPPLSQKKGGWRARVRAVEAAWAVMWGGNKANAAALNAASDWAAEALAPADALAALQPQAYAALLPVVWELLLHDGEMLEALASAALKQPGSGAKRRASDAMLMRVVRVHEDAFAEEPLFVPLASPARGLVAQWIGAAPRTLWELGTRDAAATNALLQFLLELSPARRAFEAPYSLVSAEAVAGIPGKLGPFFHLQHASRGAVAGPWTALPAQEQRLALDAARVWAQEDASGRLAAAVVRAVTGPGAPGWARAYWEQDSV